MNLSLTNPAAVIAALLLSIIGSMEPAHARQIVTQCNQITGKSYYVSPDDKWQDDGMTGGTFTIVREDDKSYDVIIKDASATAFTAKGDGGAITPLKEEGGNITILVIYPLNVIEIYQLTLDSNGSGVLLFSTVKNGVGTIDHPVTKGSLFTAACNKR
jgi:hypothetical protein